MESGGCIYILTNFENTVLYIGVTSELFLELKTVEISYTKNLLLQSIISLNWFTLNSFLQ